MGRPLLLGLILAILAFNDIQSSVTTPEAIRSTLDPNDLSATTQSSLSAVNELTYVSKLYDEISNQPPEDISGKIVREASSPPLEERNIATDASILMTNPYHRSFPTAGDADDVLPRSDASKPPPASLMDAQIVNGAELTTTESLLTPNTPEQNIFQSMHVEKDSNFIFLDSDKYSIDGGVIDKDISISDRIGRHEIFSKRLELHSSNAEIQIKDYSRDTFEGSVSLAGEVRSSVASVPAVWGEVGRGIVAVGEDRGDLGRRPLVLSGGKKGRARSGPYFEEDFLVSNISAPAGSTVLLDCRVAMLQDKVVTWASRKDDRLRLLTVGRQAYSADKRLSLSFRYPNNWRLQISKAGRPDQGLYECQVAAHPPIIKQIYLTVISPEVSISDESGRAVVERYYKSGSSLQLTCTASQLLEPPSMLAWWQGGNLLADGISICNVTGADSATCTLMVDQVSRSHAGTYTCGAFPPPQPHAAQPAPPQPHPLQAEPTLPPQGYYANATVAVHVLHGNLIGIAVLPNTGKSTGANGIGYISVQKIALGLIISLLIHDR